MPKVEVIFFDLYNTLVYSTSNDNLYGKYFKLCGLRQKTDISRAKKIALTENFTTLNDLGMRLGVEKLVEDSGITVDIENEILHISLFPDVLDALNDLRKKGLRLAIISNLATLYKKPVFDLGLDRLCSHLFFSCDMGFRKPDKEIYTLSCEAMGIQPSSGLMIGDNKFNDYMGAKRIGLDALLLNRRGCELSIPNIKSLAELPEIFE